MRDPIADRFVRTHLKTRHLVLLVELGRHGSILRAAEAAHMTQPAASKLLAELEYALGVQLFDRLARGIAPTWYGEIMIRRAGTALAEMNTAHQEVMELFSGLRGQVAIGSVMTPSTSLVPRAVQRFKEHHPLVNVSIQVESSTQLLQQLRAGQLDMMIGRLISGNDTFSELKFETLQDEPHKLIVRADHPLSRRHDLRLDELAQAAWILPASGSILRDRLSALFLSQGVDLPANAIETSAIPVITSLLLSSDVIIALPPETVQHYLDAGALVELDVDLGLRMDAYGIITRKQHRLSPGAQAMLDVLRSLA
ncbi:MAG: LysR family transcriptional regulator [Burkholderiales bacterium]|nr:LysR family transcriptional regulator [Burkholderiales bacterium]